MHISFIFIFSLTNKKKKKKSTMYHYIIQETVLILTKEKKNMGTKLYHMHAICSYLHHHGREASTLI